MDFNIYKCSCGRVYNEEFQPLLSHSLQVSRRAATKNNKMKFIIFTFVTCLALATSYAHIGGGAALQNISPQVYCGRSLARAMAFLCFEEDGFEKRSDIGTMYGQILPPYYKEQEVQMGLPWAGRARSLSLAGRGKRTPGIVTECCDKPCSINELLSYC